MYLDETPLPPAVIETDVAVRRGVVYSSAPGYRPLELDLYAPLSAWGTASSRPYPAIVWIHGGAFAMGSRHLLPDFLTEVGFFRRLAHEGFVVASIDYRLSSEGIWPAQLLDVRAAVRWLRARADELSIDADSIAVWGESAGAHLAALAGLLGDTELDSEPDGWETPRVAAVIDWYGPTNFALMDGHAPIDSLMTHDDPDSPESRLLGAPVQEVPDLVADADPASHVSAGAPPFLVVHGRADRLVPFGQSEHLVAALERAGASVRFHPVDGADHVFENHEDPGVFIDQAVAFLHDVLPAARRARKESA